MTTNVNGVAIVPLGRAMRSDLDDVFLTPPVDGIALLPSKPGIYGMLNRITRKFNVGQSTNILSRCVLHRSQMRAGTSANMRMRRDADRYGPDVWTYLALAVVDATDVTNLARQLDRLEVFWVVQLQAHDEVHGYVSEAGHCRTRGARFRDRERKLLRSSSEKYELLPTTDINDPISETLLSAWVPGS
jgi:hypothetical protein